MIERHTASCRVNYQEGVCTCGFAPLTDAPTDALCEVVIEAMKHHTIQGAFQTLQDGRRALDELRRRAKLSPDQDRIEAYARGYENGRQHAEADMERTQAIAREPFDPQIDYPERYGRRP